MSNAKLTAALAPAALGLVALGAVASNAVTSPPQTSIEGRKRPATVYMRPDVLGLQSTNMAEVLGDDKRRTIAGELIQITSDAILLEIKSDRLWIPRENVIAVYYDV